MKRYQVKLPFHLSVIGRQMRQGSVIEVDEKNSVFRIDGETSSSIDEINNEAIRVILAIASDSKKLLEELPNLQFDNRPITQTLTMFPVLGCLKAAEEWLGRPLFWHVINDEQQEFMELFFEKGMDHLEKLGQELRRKAAGDIGTINKWLEENNFEVRLTVPVGPGGFAVASILDVRVSWLQEGRRTTIKNEHGQFDAVKLTDSQGVAFLQNPAVHNHCVAKILTKSGDKVYMTKVDGLPGDRFAIESRIRSIMVGLTHEDHRYDALSFPMVDYNRNPDISFLQGMNTPSVAPGYFIAQAKQQTKFRMNHVGARVESAVAMGFMRSLSEPIKKMLVMDQPFLLWIMRDGIDMPLFGGIFAEDVWKDPKTLE